MTDDLDRMLMVALEGCAAKAPGLAGFTDVRRRVRRRRQRHSALVALPTLVGVGAMATWTKGGDDERVVSGEPTTTETSISPSNPPGSTQGFRCSDAGMTAGDVDAWLYFQGCEPWDGHAVAPITSFANVEQVPTTWADSVMAAVAFLNASSVDGIATFVAGTQFGSGDAYSSPIMSATSFVMYDNPRDEALAADVGAELGIPVRASVDAAYLGSEQVIATVFVVIGEDLAAQLTSSDTSGDTPVSNPVIGPPTRCWDSSEIEVDDPGYRYFTICEPTQPEGGVDTSLVEPADGTVASTVTSNDCEQLYTLVDGDSPVDLAERFGLSLSDLDAANVDTRGYDAFYLGLVIVIPCVPGA